MHIFLFELEKNIVPNVVKWLLPNINGSNNLGPIAYTRMKLKSFNDIDMYVKRTVLIFVVRLQTFSYRGIGANNLHTAVLMVSIIKRIHLYVRVFFPTQSDMP